MFKYMAIIVLKNLRKALNHNLSTNKEPQQGKLLCFHTVLNSFLLTFTGFSTFYLENITLLRRNVCCLHFVLCWWWLNVCAIFTNKWLFINIFLRIARSFHAQCELSLDRLLTCTIIATYAGYLQAAAQRHPLQTHLRCFLQLWYGLSLFHYTWLLLLCQEQNHDFEHTEPMCHDLFLKWNTTCTGAYLYANKKSLCLL